MATKRPRAVRHCVEEWSIAGLMLLFGTTTLVQAFAPVNTLLTSGLRVAYLRNFTNEVPFPAFENRDKEMLQTRVVNGELVVPPGNSRLALTSMASRIWWRGLTTLLCGTTPQKWPSIFQRRLVGSERYSELTPIHLNS